MAKIKGVSVAAVAAPRKEAKGFLNISVIDTDGVAHRLPTGLRLLGEGLEQLLLDSAIANPGRSFTLTGTVHVIGDDADKAVITL
jgi:hypothetical protein